MRKLLNISCIVASCLMITIAKAQQPQSAPLAPAEQDPAMKNMMEYMTPGEKQKMLARSMGDWKAEITMMMDPTQPPMKSNASVHNEMILGGRYLTTRYTGMMMNMPFEGMGTIAYDNGKKVYMETWIDNMGTGIMYMEGTLSADGKSVEYKGSGFDPMQGKVVPMRQVVTFANDNDHTIQMFQNMNGKEVKVMEIHLTR